jgi:RNA polymerase sigma-70 factor (ECF subfamily)
VDLMVEPAPAAGPADLSAAVAAAQAGDEGAFRELFRAVHPALVRYLRGLIGDDADDVASETWLQVCRDLPRFTGDYANFRAWTTTIARHRALDHARRQRRRPSVPVPVEALADLASGADTAHEAADAVATGAAIALIATLPAQQAEAVLLRVVMGLDAETAGRILGKRPGAVRTAAYRGLRRLAALMPEESP